MNSPAYAVDAYVLDTLMRDLVAHDRRPSAFLVYLTLATAAGKGRVSMSYAQLAEQTGLSRRSVQDAITILRKRGLVDAARRTATETTTYEPLRPWIGA